MRERITGRVCGCCSNPRQWRARMSERSERESFSKHPGQCRAEYANLAQPEEGLCIGSTKLTERSSCGTRAVPALPNISKNRIRVSNTSTHSALTKNGSEIIPDNHKTKNTLWKVSTGKKAISIGAAFWKLCEVRAAWCGLGVGRSWHGTRSKQFYTVYNAATSSSEEDCR